MGQRSEAPDRELAQKILKRKLRRSPESQCLHRLHCVLLIGEGFSCQEVAAWFGDCPRTLERWIYRFKKSGFEGLAGEQRTGRPAKLNHSQLEALQKGLCREPNEFGFDQGRWSGKLLVTHIQNRFGVVLSVRHCQRLLRGFNLEKPVGVAQKARL